MVAFQERRVPKRCPIFNPQKQITNVTAAMIRHAVSARGRRSCHTATRAASDTLLGCSSAAATSFTGRGYRPKNSERRINKNGMAFSLLAGKNNVRSLIDENEYQMAAEQDVRNERWTVAQDKVLLRMYYCDMGIHAIHKCLQRTYAAVYARIHSITQPEELLKGREFEDYVLSLFNLQEDGLLILQEWQGDKSYGLVKPENNSNPDFVFRYNQKEFAIECKWRERLDADMSKDIFTKKRLDNYKKFSEERKMSVAIILGIGGEPCAPELLYIIPLDKITDIISYEKSINSFRIFPNNFDISCVMPARERVNSYTVEEKRKLYKNAYKKWSIEEDEQLLSLFGENKSIEELTIVFNRNEGAIRSRINKLAQKRK